MSQSMSNPTEVELLLEQKDQGVWKLFVFEATVELVLLVGFIASLHSPVMDI